MTRGKFISFEGLDGVGKTTQAKHISQYLRATCRLTVHETREPGGTAFGETLRSLILHTGKTSAITDTLLFYAARSHHIDTVIRPALSRGEWVICDRYNDSSIAYQNGGHYVPISILEKLSDSILDENSTPDLTVYLRSPNKVLKDAPTDKFEKQGDEFFQRVVASYDSIAAKEDRVSVVHAFSGSKRKSEEDITDTIIRAITNKFFRNNLES